MAEHERTTIAGEAERIQQTITRDARRRALVAGCIGNLVEWYDFALWLRVQIATTDNGASTHATTMSRVATIVRHRWRAPRPTAADRPLPAAAACWACERRVVTSARSRCSSARSAR